jgi:pimeloyl-ACP methyl ester carboxylesterase
MAMKNARCYGDGPYRVAVVHGGPGAPGEMAPVARALSNVRGILEPLQTAASVDGQVEELAALLAQYGTRPVVLIGYSWGAWLGLIYAARYPVMVRKLILVSCSAPGSIGAKALMTVRMSRLCPDDQEEIRSLSALLGDPAVTGKDRLFARFGAIISRADTCCPAPDASAGKGLLPPEYDVYRRVWDEAEALRAGGTLLEYCGRVRCPVTAIHGDYDPSPAEWVREPLARTIRDLRFIVLERCGHTPWIERHARERFYSVLEEELRDAA